MNKILIACALLGGAIAAGQEPASEPTPPAEQVQQLPEAERLAAREAVKKVMLYRTLKLKEDASRLTAKNMADSVERAVELKAPEAFIRLLRREASESMSGRERYELRLALSKLVAAYGVDTLQMRLFMEGLPYPPREIGEALEWLPLENVFNLVPQGDLPIDTLEFQLVELADTYRRMADIYKDVSNTEQAEAAADQLLELLPGYDATSPARLQVLEKQNERLEALYQRLVMPMAEQMLRQRFKLREAGYFDSRRLAVIDYLLG